MKRLSKLCCRRPSFAEVYSQAYSQSFMEDQYLAKQRQVPSSSSMLSMNDLLSLGSVGSDDDFVQLVTSVDLIKIGADYDEKKALKRHKKGIPSTTLESMKMKTVTSIEESRSGDLDVEAHLESEDDSSGNTNSSDGGDERHLLVNPMDYHMVSKRCAKKKGRGASQMNKNPVTSLLRVKQKLMKLQHFDMMEEDRQEMEEASTSDSSIPVRDPPGDFLTPGTVVRSNSSTSVSYIESY
jgi:hypothetical protein